MGLIKWSVTSITANAGNDGGCQTAFREIPSCACDDLIEGRPQDEVEPERRRPAEAYCSGNVLVEKRERLRCLVFDLYDGKASAFEVRRHLICGGKEALRGRCGPGRWVLWLFSAG